MNILFFKDLSLVLSVMLINFGDYFVYCVNDDIGIRLWFLQSYLYDMFL